MENFIKKLEDKDQKITFGLVAQGHIPTIEKIIKKWNDSNIYGNDMTYSKVVWDEIGKKINWHPLTAALSYFEYILK